MHVTERQFDRDLALFDASACLSELVGGDVRNGCWNCLTSESRKEIRDWLPRLWETMKPHLKGEGLFELWFGNYRLAAKSGAQDLRIDGPARIAIISSADPSQFAPGTLIDVPENQSIELPFLAFRNHFVGVARWTE